jgi:hypothetical protein
MQSLSITDQQINPDAQNNKTISSVSGQERNGVRKKEKQLRLFAHIFNSINEGIIFTDAEKTCYLLTRLFPILPITALTI